jgi:hypothetical protein
VNGSCEHVNEPLGYIKYWGNSSGVVQLMACPEGHSSMELLLH